MKKTLALMLAMVLALTGLCCIPALADIPVLSSSGVELRITSYKLHDDDDPDLSLYVYVSNDNDYEIHISGGDCFVDGTPCRALGFSIGPYEEYGDDSQSIMIVATKEDPSAGAAALRSARQIELDVKLLDNNYKTVLTQHISMSVDNGTLNTDGSGSNGGSSDNGVDNLDFGHGGGTAPAYTPASTNYQTLKQGSKGQAVRDLQQRLTDLGYLNDKVDGAYGRNTNTAVRSFCSQNGLPIRSEATPEMQELLYSSSAQYYVEPYIPLVIGATFTKKRPDQVNYGGYDGELTISLVNRSSTRTIRGYVIYYYQTDMYGNRINLAGTTPALEEIYYNEMNRIEPGHYDDAISYMIRQYYGTYAVYVGIQKIVFDDGEIRELDLNDVDFYECVIAE